MNEVVYYILQLPTPLGARDCLDKFSGRRVANTFLFLNSILAVNKYLASYRQFHFCMYNHMQLQVWRLVSRLVPALVASCLSILSILHNYKLTIKWTSIDCNWARANAAMSDGPTGIYKYFIDFERKIFQN